MPPSCSTAVSMTFWQVPRSDIAWAADGLAALGLHQAHRLISVCFFGLQVAEHNVGALPGEGQGDGAADPGPPQ